MPIIFLPLAIGVVGSAVGLVQAIELAIEDGERDRNVVLLLSWALLPVVLGGALCCPAYFVAALGRLWLVGTRPGITKPQIESPSTDSFAQRLASDEQAYQAYADLVTASGHRRKG